MTDTMRFRGKDYKIGEEFEQFPIYDLVPRVLPHSWDQLRPNRHPNNILDDSHCFGYENVTGLKVIITAALYGDSKRWLHVSLSRRDRMPTLQDIKEVKNLFVGREKTALQVFPPASKYVNMVDTVLHLWHCLDGDVTPDFTGGGETL